MLGVSVQRALPNPKPPTPVTHTEPNTDDPDLVLAWILDGQPEAFEIPPEGSTLRRIASTVRATSEWYGVDPRLIARLIRVESYVDTLAPHPPIMVTVDGERVRTRAVGLGGIVPEIWLGVFPECGEDLRRVRDNVCYTVRVWKWFRDRSPGDLEFALLSYNGCRRGWSCDWYADAIMDVVE